MNYIGRLLALALLLGESARCGDEVDEHLDWSLMCAAQSGDLKTVEALVKRGVNVNAVAVDGWTPLMKAAERGHADIVRILIAAGADVHARDWTYGTPLWKRAGIPTIQRLIESAGAKSVVAAVAAPARPPFSATPQLSALRDAAESGSIHRMAAALASGADIDARIDATGRTALILAAEKAVPEAVEYLASRGADLNLTTHPPSDGTGGEAAITRTTDLATVRMLLFKGADPNGRGRWQRTALQMAAERGDAGLVKALLVGGADVNAEDTLGQTALLTAAERGDVETVNVLLAHGKFDSTRDAQLRVAIRGAARKPNRAELLAVLEDALPTDRAHPRGPITELMEAALENDLPRATALIAAGADVNARGPHRETALHLALKHQPPSPQSVLARTTLAKLLLAHGADAAAEDDESHTPLFHAVASGHAELVIAMLDRGGDKGARYFGWTALMVATIAGDARRVEALIAKGAPLHQKNEHGATAAQLAARSSAGVLKLLTDAPQKAPQKKQTAQEALRASALAANYETVRLLLAKGATPSAAHLDEFLATAVLAGDPRLAKLWLDKGAPINAQRMGEIDPLRLAVGNLAMTRLLLERGADVDWVDIWGNPALNFAAIHGNLEVIKLLIAHGAEINPRPRPIAIAHCCGIGCLPVVAVLTTPLHLAAEAGHVEVVRFLIEHGGSKTVNDFEGRTPLDRALLKNRAEVADVLRGGAQFPMRPPAVRWSFKIDGRISPPAFASDGTIYIAAREYGRKLFALSPRGEKIAECKLRDGPHDPVSAPVLGSDGTIYVAGEFLQARSPDGSPKWEFAGDGAITGSPVLGPDGTVYFAGSKTVHAVKPDGLKRWAFQPGREIIGIAMGSDGTIYLTSNGWLHAISAVGAEKWRREIRGELSAPALAADGTIHLAANGARLCATAADGAGKWNVELRGDRISQPAVGPDGTIYLATGGTLRAFDADGAVKWEFAGRRAIEVSSFAFGGDGTIYLGALETDGANWLNYRVIALDAAGRRQWDYDVDKGRIPLRPALGPDGAVFVISDDGALTALAHP